MIYSTSISTCYKKLPIIFSTHSFAQKHRKSLEHIINYEKTTAERYILERLLEVLDQKASERYRSAVEKLHKYEVERGTVVKSIPIAAVREKPLSSAHASIVVTASSSLVGSGVGTYYNAVKQKWARDLIASINTVMTKIMAEVGSKNPTNKAVFDKLNTELQGLIAAGTNLTEENFQSLYNFPDAIFTAIQRADTFTGGIKTDFTNQLAIQYGNQATLTQTFADSRVEGLNDILTAVEGVLTSEQLVSFAEIKKELQTLADHVGNFDEAGLQQIGDAGEKLAAIINASELTRNDKIMFCQHITDLYSDQVTALGSFDTVLDASIYVNQHQKGMFTDLTSFLGSLIGVFAPIDLSSSQGDISSAALAGALQTARGLNSRFNELTSAQQQLINQCAQSLSSFKCGEHLGAIWAYFTTSTVVALNPTATMNDVKAVILEEAKELDNSSFELAAPMKAAMTQIVNSNGSFSITVNSQNFQYTIYSNNSGKVEINQILLNYGSTGFLPEITKLAKAVSENTARSYFRFKALANVESESLEAKIEDLQDQLKQFTNMKTELFNGQLLAQASELRALPLPSAVASVLIDRYMPKEVDYLNEIYKKLYYSNLGSSVGNAIIKSISQYVNGATYFNFASYVGQQPAVGAGGSNAFPGSKESAQAKLDLERKQAALYLQETRGALTVVAEQRDKVIQDDKLTNEQRSMILDALRTYEDNINAVSGSLVLLQNYLLPLSIAAGSVAGTFIVNGGQDQWQSRLQILEEALVSGLVGNVINGGMFPLQSTIQSDQQSFADMGQNFQLDLQMHLTSMQQEWTVVATSLQLLNQMYLSLARSLTG
ncbi:CT620/CT621 family type III secretion system effector [Candidatus Chlamydia corallus]|uniref:CT620/CT621 family type III secretion system effector n=1 Tax=Candidatus Chlamydia corallus TaxID=2038470 RepID=UPI000C2FB216|nr:CT620/CT621 family type III secretion system effector [Candidatus Chlamydia corallus]